MVTQLSSNFFEWGIKCPELETNSAQVFGVSPIASISFKWSTVQPELVTHASAESTNRTYGIGQATFEMFQSNIKCKIQDSFKMQTLLPIMIFIHYANENGKPIEQERYEFENVVIMSYESESKSDQIGQRDIVQIHSKGDYRYIQIIRENGRAMGQIASRPYNTQRGIL
jgi:hypothetical protein